MIDQVQHVIYADTFLKRLKGLKKEPDNTMLILPNCRSIHTFGIRKSLKILFLDKKGKIIKKIARLQPYKIIIGPKKTHTIIEII